MTHTTPTDAICSRTSELAACGIRWQQIADAEQIGRRTLRQWLRRGRREARRLEASETLPRTNESAYRSLWLAYATGRAQCEIRCVQAIARAAEGGDAQAASWLLERRYPSRWSALVDLKQRIDEIRDESE